MTGFGTELWSAAWKIIALLFVLWLIVAHPNEAFTVALLTYMSILHLFGAA